jgi:hypothetical protein
MYNGNIACLISELYETPKYTMWQDAQFPHITAGRACNNIWVSTFNVMSVI